VGCILLLLVYATVFDAPTSKVVKEIVNKIHSQLDSLERAYPNSTIYALGDFNSASVKLPRYNQQVTSSTRKNRTLDKCYASVSKNVYKCYKLPKLGTSDHDAVMLLPKYTHKHKYQPVHITKQLWSCDNIAKLADCLDSTDWATLLSDTDVTGQVAVFTDYLNFFIDVCIPTVTVRNRSDKSWMNGKIRRLVAQRCKAVYNNDVDTIKHLRSQIQREIRIAKSLYAKNIEQSFKSKPSDAWKSLKSVLKLNSSKAGCQFDANVLNKFYNRFDKPPCTDVFLPDLCDVSSLLFSLDDVYFVLKSVNTRKSGGPDNIPPRLIQSMAHILAHPVQTLYNNCLRTGSFPDGWKLANIIPIPKCKSPQLVKDFRPVALTPTLAKCFEHLIMKFLQPVLNDPYQFAYRPGRSTEDAIILALNTITTS
jgi:hypothetical protein